MAGSVSLGALRLLLWAVAREGQGPYLGFLRVRSGMVVVVVVSCRVEAEFRHHGPLCQRGGLALTLGSPESLLLQTVVGRFRGSGEVWGTVVETEP